MAGVRADGLLLLRGGGVYDLGSAERAARLAFLKFYSTVDAVTHKEHSFGETLKKLFERRK